MRNNRENKEHSKRNIDRTGNPRYRLTEDEAEMVFNYRRIKQEAEKEGLDPKSVHSGWIKNKHASLYFKNDTNKKDQDKFLKDLLDSYKEHAPNYTKIYYEESNNNHLLVLDPADIHIGKIASELETGESYDSQEAVIRVITGVNSILSKCKGFFINRICLVMGNDVLHYDTPNKTTKGTQVDSDGLMWYECFLMAKRLYVQVIETLLSIAPVHAVYCPSNHDYQSSFFLAQCIEAHFKNCADISFDNSPSYRKYLAYENNLLGFTHGDKAKHNDLPLLMATEAAHLWAKCDRRYIYTHHIHSKFSKDYLNVCLESLRSPSPSDSWHHQNGYLNSPAVEGYLHNKNGQIARITHFF
jgi:hypothetical protein